MSDQGVATTEDTQAETLRCARHPGVETVLRCGRCETPICPRCMVPTPVGARCPTCAQVKRFAMLAKPKDLALGGLYGFLTAAAGGAILTFIPFFGLIGLAVLGFLTSEGVLRGANRKRAPELGVLSIVCLFLGYAVSPLLAFLLRGRGIPLELVPGVILGLPLALLANPIVLLGLGVGSLIAWMRLR